MFVIQNDYDDDEKEEKRNDDDNDDGQKRRRKKCKRMKMRMIMSEKSIPFTIFNEKEVSLSSSVYVFITAAGITTNKTT